MKYEKNQDGSYLHNCYVKLRNSDGVTLFDNTNGSVKASLNGYAVIPIEDYFDLVQGVSCQKLELSELPGNMEKIKEAHSQLHGPQKTEKVNMKSTTISLSGSI